MKAKSIFLMLVLMIFSGCTIAPLTEPYTAKTLGKGNNEWQFGIGSYVSVAYRRGVNDRLDIGGIFEVQAGAGGLIGLDGKYQLSSLSNPDPISLIFGAGIGDSSKYAYFGPIKSFRRGNYELGINLRANVFEWDIDLGDRNDVEDASEFLNDFIEAIEDGVNGTYVYVSGDISNTYWFNSITGLTLSLGGIYFVEDGEDVGLKAGLNLHFKY